MKEGKVSDKQNEYRKMATIFNQRQERIKRLESKNKEREEYWIFINDRILYWMKNQCSVVYQSNWMRKKKRSKEMEDKISKD